MNSQAEGSDIGVFMQSAMLMRLFLQLDSAALKPCLLLCVQRIISTNVNGNTLMFSMVIRKTESKSCEKGAMIHDSLLSFK